MQIHKGLEIRAIFQDDILNASSNASCRICEQLILDEESWHRLYDVLVKTLNEILDNPEFKNYN